MELFISVHNLTRICVKNDIPLQQTVNPSFFFQGPRVRVSICPLLPVNFQVLAVHDLTVYGGS